MGSKKREQELLMALVEKIKVGKINECSAMLDGDREKKLHKYCDDVSYETYLLLLCLMLFM